MSKTPYCDPNQVTLPASGGQIKFRLKNPDTKKFLYQVGHLERASEFKCVHFLSLLYSFTNEVDATLSAGNLRSEHVHGRHGAVGHSSDGREQVGRDHKEGALTLLQCHTVPCV